MYFKGFKGFKGKESMLLVTAVVATDINIM